MPTSLTWVPEIVAIDHRFETAPYRQARNRWFFVAFLKTRPAPHIIPRKRTTSRHYIYVVDRRGDELWDAGWRAFVTITGTSCGTGRSPFLNGGLLKCLTHGRVFEKPANPVACQI